VGSAAPKREFHEQLPLGDRRIRPLPVRRRNGVVHQDVPVFFGRPRRLFLHGVRLARVPGHLLGGLGRSLRRPLQIRQRPRDTVRRRGVDVPPRVFPPERRRRRPPAALLPGLRPSPAPAAPRRRPRRQAAARAGRAARALGPASRLEGDGGARAGALARFGREGERPGGSPDHVDSLRPRARDAALPGDGARGRGVPGARSRGHHPVGLAPQRRPLCAGVVRADPPHDGRGWDRLRRGRHEDVQDLGRPASRAGLRRSSIWVAAPRAMACST
jgi:hypothetical protein